jgi:N-acetylglucosaminyldiphosphoundecaprenol N-acetyl-beta-D-mannosaminyltransferase
MDRRVVLDGIAIDRRTEAEIVAYVRDSLHLGRGGRVVTPNVDVLRLARRDPGLRARLARAPLPERVAGSRLARSLAAGLAADGRSLYLLGGAPADHGRVEGAHRAARRLVRECPGLRIAGHASPRRGFDRDPGTLEALYREIVDAAPDVVYLDLGAPTQDRLAERLRADLPGAWLLGCAGAIDFLAGDAGDAGGAGGTGTARGRARAPEWMRRSRLAWAHRLVREPGQLADRCLRHDTRYAVGLLLRSAVRRR